MDDGLLNDDPETYRRLVGKLNYLIYTRMDIAFAVQYLSQFISTLRATHMEVAKHTHRYIKLNRKQGILMSVEPNYKLTDYCDSN